MSILSTALHISCCHDDDDDDDNDEDDEADDVIVVDIMMGTSVRLSIPLHVLRNRRI